MYEFIDVTQTQEDVSEGTLLPSEAMKINGEYIENLIPEYRTLTVEGREALSREIETYEVGSRNGSEMKGARYPARTIRVTYQLRCASNEDFRAAYNKLAGILSVENAELIFEDEPDKYFIGTPSYVGEVEPGRNSVIGEFEIVCLDPFKYSVMEYEATAEPGGSGIFIDYGGTYKSFPKLVAEFHKESEASEDGETEQTLTGDGECGFVAFFNEREKIIQLGDPDETDGDDEGYEASQTLINASFAKANAWGSAAKKQWNVNGGVLSSSKILQNGTPGIGVASYTGGNVGKTYYNKIKTLTSRASNPVVHYEVWVSVSNRAKTTADVTVTVKTRLDNPDSYFGHGYALSGEVRIGDRYKILSLKNKDDYWRGTSVHSCDFFFSKVSVESGNYYLPDISLTVTRPDGLGTTGILPLTKCGTLIVPAYVSPTPDTHYLTATNYGENANREWHGTAISRTIPADASGDRDIVNFDLSFCAKICAEEAAQKGAFECHVISGGKIVAGIECRKGNTGTTADLDIYVNGSTRERFKVDVSKKGGVFTENSSVRIKKSGSRVTFTLGKNLTLTYTDSKIAGTAAESVTFGFLQYSAAATLSHNGLCWAKFVKDNCETWKDIPNKFKTNDVCEADCRTGEITLNGSSAYFLGALGNDWEGFYLTPGLNQIGTAYSEWVSEGFEPTFKVKYREVYL